MRISNDGYAGAGGRCNDVSDYEQGGETVVGGAIYLVQLGYEGPSSEEGRDSGQGLAEVQDGTLRNIIRIGNGPYCMIDYLDTGVS